MFGRVKLTLVIAGFVPATPISVARPCPVIGVAGTSPAMTIKMPIPLRFGRGLVPRRGNGRPRPLGRPHATRRLVTPQILVIVEIREDRMGAGRLEKRQQPG